MNQIICNDALTALKDIDDNSVDIVLTSPPYNFDMQYDEQQGLDKIDVAADKIWEYVQRIKKNLDELDRMMYIIGLKI